MFSQQFADNYENKIKPILWTLINDKNGGLAISVTEV